MDIFRTIPSDTLQAKGLVHLCKVYNWDSINIIYADDAYGLWFSLKIQELAAESGITAQRISISYEAGEGALSNQSFVDAAKRINEADTYITILIIHSTNITAFFFDALEREGVLKYPYYYLGVDSWLGTQQITDMKLYGTNRVTGIIGTVPGSPADLDIDYYNFNDPGLDMDVIIKSRQIGQKFLSAWNATYRIDDTDRTPATVLPYRRDSMYTIAHCMDILDDKWVDMVRSANTTQHEVLIKKINHIITNDISFIGQLVEYHLMRMVIG